MSLTREFLYELHRHFTGEIRTDARECDHVANGMLFDRLGEVLGHRNVLQRLDAAAHGHDPAATQNLAETVSARNALLKLDGVVVVGVQLGGWIAAEMAVKSTERLSALVLGNPVGIKVGDRETRDIVDIWSLMPDDLLARSYFNPETGKRDYKSLPEDESLRAARNREATARFCWSPYMHNPKLKGRLHRINIPTLFLWGTADRIIGDGYGRAYCAMIPGAQFQPIERAGHYPHIEQIGRAHV